MPFITTNKHVNDEGQTCNHTWTEGHTLRLTTQVSKT